MPRDLPNPSRSPSFSLLNASVAHPFFVVLELEPLTLYDTLRKPYPFVARIRSRVCHIAVEELFRDAVRECGTRQPFVVVEVRALQAGEFDRGHTSESVGVRDKATAEAMRN